MASCEQEALALLKGEALLRAKKLQGEGFCRHRRRMENSEFRPGHRGRSKSLERRMSATSMEKERRYNKGVLLTVCRRHATKSKRSNTAPSSTGTESNRSGLLYSDQFGHRFNLRINLH